MNKEKLYKAARSEAFDLVDCAHKTDSHDIVEAFVQGAEWLMEQPLIERMTEKEKHLMRELYECYMQHEDTCRKIGLHDAEMIAKGSVATMRDIFGDWIANEE